LDGVDVVGDGGGSELEVGAGRDQVDAAVAERRQPEAEAVEDVDPRGLESVQVDPVVDVPVGVEFVESHA
jgi:hypothetical protein